MSSIYSIEDLQKLSQVTSTNQRFSTDQQRSITSKDISLHGISLAFGSLTILSDAVIKLAYGTKYALVGRNGIGKTTLLRCMANNMIPQWTCIRTFLVQQEFEAVSTSPIDLVKGSDPEYQALVGEIETLLGHENDEIDETDHESRKKDFSQTTTHKPPNSAKCIASLYEQLGSLFDESEMERRAISILSNDLKFSQEMMKRPFKELSGGWRMKTMLACAVFARPHLLLLDEPTNHLDLESIRWLVQFLKGLECTVIVVSHDHDFLDAYAQCIIHFTQKQLRYYPGNYSDFVTNRQDKINEQSNSERKKSKKKNKDSSPKPSLKFKTMSKKNAFDTAWVWGAESLIVGTEGADDKTLKLQFPDPDPTSISNPILQLNNVSCSFDEGATFLWRNIDLSLDATSRIAILGRNGIGKSTLLKCIANNDPNFSKRVFCTIGSGNAGAGAGAGVGQIFRHHNLCIAYFTQHLVQDIDLTKSAVQLLLQETRSKTPSSNPFNSKASSSSSSSSFTEQDARDYLGYFGISGDRALQKLAVLSGGQRTRFVFSLLMIHQPHLLLLDEPTSHLDMEMTESLISALKAYKGAFIVVSHHGYFLRKLELNSFYVLKKGSLVRIESLNDYLLK